MPPEPVESRGARAAALWGRLHGFGPVVGLVLLCIAATLLNGEFATVGNGLNVLTRTAFIGIIGGLGVYAASGLILGPITVALAVALVDIWRRRTLGGRPAEVPVKEPQVFPA